MPGRAAPPPNGSGVAPVLRICRYLSSLEVGLMLAKFAIREEPRYHSGSQEQGHMTARAMGSGTVSFGLVSIPVKLYSSSESKSGISFNLLHGKCGSRLKQQYICP